MCRATRFYFIFSFLILLLHWFDVVKYGSCQSDSGSGLEGSSESKLKQLLDDFQAQRQIIEVNQQSFHQKLEELKLGLLTYKRDEDAHSKAIQRKIDDLKQDIVSQFRLQLDKFRDENEAQFRAILQDISKLLTSSVSVQSGSPHAISCEAAFKANAAQNGAYNLDLSFYNLGKMSVYCIKDPQNAHPWLLVLRRQDNTTDFDLPWHDYKTGLGDLYGNYFIGLEALHKLTYGQPQELWVQLEDFDGVKRWAKYGTFAVSNEAEKYTLKEIGNYSGDAGDSLTQHKGRQFQTKDITPECTEYFKSGWWFHSCFDSNLMGPYLYGEIDHDGGISWGKFHGHRYSLKYAHMAIRPVKSKSR